MMPQVFVEQDEWYPYIISTAGDAIDISEGELAEIQRVFAEFEVVQKRLRELVEEGEEQQ